MMKTFTVAGVLAPYSEGPPISCFRQRLTSKLLDSQYGTAATFHILSNSLSTNNTISGSEKPEIKGRGDSLR
jgi:hypothetical protein